MAYNTEIEIICAYQSGLSLGQFIARKHNKRGHSACFETLRKWGKIWRECERDIHGYNQFITGEY